MIKEPRNTLTQVAALLRQGGEIAYAERIDKITKGTEKEFWGFLVSNDLWGGAGSIADQGLIKNKELRPQLQYLLIELGELQGKMGKVNVRTDMWVSAFKQWKQQGII